MSILPNLIIIGAAKCGTSSLHYYLNLHPEIMMSKRKELHFFDEKQNWHKGLGWYKSNFWGNKKIFGETSPSYSYYPMIRGVPEKMHAIIPNARIMYIIRNPIERIKSHYMTRFAAGKEDHKLEESLINIKNNLYTFPSMYYYQLKQYFPYYPKSKILVITLESLIQQCETTMTSVFQFLQVDDKFKSPYFSQIKNPSIAKKRKNKIGMILRYLSETSFARLFSDEFRRNVGNIVYKPFSQPINRPVINESLKRRLIDYFRDDLSNLSKFTGQDYNEWY